MDFSAVADAVWLTVAYQQWLSVWPVNMVREGHMRQLFKRRLRTLLA